MVKVLVLQAFGIGDCIFAQSIAHHFLEQNIEVLWPVRDEYYDGLNMAYPKVKWIPQSIVKDPLFEIKEKTYVSGILISPIRWSDSYMKVPYKEVMRAKYAMYGLDWKTWRNHAMPERNYDREHQLMDYLGISPKTKYNLIATQFGMSGARAVDIQVTNGFKNVNMEIVPGFHLFDWCGVIENADTIHAVSSSTLYLFEVMKLRASEVHLYVRKGVEANFSFVDYLFTKNYILHQ